MDFSTLGSVEDPCFVWSLNHCARYLLPVHRVEGIERSQFIVKIVKSGKIIEADLPQDLGVLPGYKAVGKNGTRTGAVKGLASGENVQPGARIAEAESDRVTGHGAGPSSVYVPEEELETFDDVKILDEETEASDDVQEVLDRSKKVCATC